MTQDFSPLIERVLAGVSYSKPSGPLGNSVNSGHSMAMHWELVWHVMTNCIVIKFRYSKKPQNLKKKTS